jgi:hypothetical protein
MYQTDVKIGRTGVIAKGSRLWNGENQAFGEGPVTI